MACKITVLVRVGGTESWLFPLVRSIDSQTLGYDLFEVVFVLAPDDTQYGARLRELAMRRPNVRVIEGSLTPDSADQPVGEWELDLGSDLATTRPVLFSKALQRLLEFAESNDCDFVLGRTVPANASVVTDIMTADRTNVEEVQQSALDTALVLRRRTLAAGDLLTTVNDAKGVGVLGSYPVARVATRRGAAASTTVRTASYEWRDGRLRIQVDGVSGPADAKLVLSVRHLASGNEYWLDTDGERTPHGTYRGAAELDVRRIARGDALFSGVWQLAAGVHGDGTSSTSRTALPSGELPSALIDGVLVAVGSANGTLSLDIGATRTSMVGTVAPSAVSVHEDFRGSLMRMTLDLAVSGRTRKKGFVKLGDFQLPAYLVGDADGARVECYLSGLPGSISLITKFGGAAATRTGLLLDVSPTGHFSVTTERARPRHAAASAAATKAGAAPRRLERAPSALQPALRAAARNNTVRRVYRKLLDARSGTS